MALATVTMDDIRKVVDLNRPVPSCAVGEAAMALAHPVAKAPEVDRAELLESAGLGQKTILAKLRAKLDATKIVPLGQGEFTETDDNQAQLKATELGLKLHGMIDKQADVNVGTINILWHTPPPIWAQGKVNQTEIELNSKPEKIPAEVQLKVLGSDPAAPSPTHPPQNSLSNRLSKRKRKEKIIK